MKKNHCLRFWSILTIFSMITLIANAQAPSAAERKAAEIKKLETALNNAKAKVALNERKLEIADSLIAAGEKMIEETRIEDKAIKNEQKALDKEYNTARKPIYKNTTSKDKETATAAKAELKALDTKYKADTKALTTRYSESTKKFNAANSNISRGTASKKSSYDALKLSQKNLETAQERYDAATGAPAEDKKKK